MVHALERLSFLKQLVERCPFGLFTDFDGTISDIAATPREARISPRSHRHLSSLCGKLSLVAIVSGRPVRTLADMVGIPEAVYIGNHGLERLEDGQALLQPGSEEHSEAVQKAAEAVKKALAGIQGIVYEEKGPVVAVHYRGCTDRANVEGKILCLLEGPAREGRIRIGRGRMVVEAQPPVEFSKGAAALEMIRRHSLRAGIYLGDDLTDIDAFQQMRRSLRGGPFVGVGVAVAGDETSPEVAGAADYTLDGPRDVERFLRWLDREVS